MIEFIGKLHPLLVHLPIGMIIVALTMEWMGEFTKFSSLKKSTKFIFLVALISSVLSLLTGYQLSLEEANDAKSVDLHKWFAIITTVFLLIHLIIWEKASEIKILHHSLLIILLLLISITGHLGGSLTHGEGYLTFKVKQENNLAINIPPISNIQEAKVYDDVTKYILKEKCESCHGSERQKGKLRLDNIENIMKGGKSGKVVDMQNYSQSELIKRILLDQTDEHHMPPKKEIQLTINEVKILEWWVSNKCTADKTFSAYKLDSALQGIINNYVKERNQTSTSTFNARSFVTAITESQKQRIQNCGMTISQVQPNDNHIRVTGFNIEKPMKEVIAALDEVKLQLIELKLGHANLIDDNLKNIASFINVEKLWIDHNKITDGSILYLKNLKNLSYLNISGNQVSKDAVSKLIDSNPNLKTLIAIEIPFTDLDKQTLKQKFKGIYLSIGKDTMEKVPSDTLFLPKK